MEKLPINLLVLSSLFPHKGEPTLGIFVQNRLLHLIAQENVQATVIAPVPWFPFKGKLFGKYGRAAQAPRVETREGLTIHHPRYFVIPKIGMMLTPLFMFWSVNRCVQKLIRQGLKIDVIDAHYLYPDGVAASKLSASIDRPFVLTARGSDVTEIALISTPKAMIKEAVSKAAHTITVSNNLRLNLISMGCDPQKITTLRNGVDLKRFYEVNRNQTRERWGQGPIMLFAGWLIPRKRLDLVLGVTASIPDLKTVIVGDGPQRTELADKAVELGIVDRVIFEGQIKPEEMPAIYSGADILILPSDREGWANVLLEAMACGTPVISREVGGAPDLVTKPEAGRIVRADTAEALSHAVVNMLSNLPERSETRAFAEAYDWSATSKGQKVIFEKAIADNASKKAVGEE